MEARHGTQNLGDLALIQIGIGRATMRTVQKRLYGRRIS
jgi:hypothetical protein